MIVIGIVAPLFVFLFVTSYLAYRKAFYVPKNSKENICAIPFGEQYECVKEHILSLIKEMDALTYESISITASDGVKLYARYYHVHDGAPLQIQFHGYRGSAFRDFCGGHKLAREAGHNILLVDQRAHGKSGGNTITFGIKERYDCLSWVNYAVERFGKETPIFLSGVSMGAATVLMASELNLPDNVVGMIADSPYSSPDEIIRKVCREDISASWSSTDFAPLHKRKERLTLPVPCVTFVIMRSNTAFTKRILQWLVIPQVVFFAESRY